jgi:hypothetical protein
LDHAKEDLCHPIDDGVDPLAKLSETRDGEAGEDRNQQDLQKIAASESANEGFRDDPKQMGDKPLLLGAIDVACDRICIKRGRIDVEPFAGLKKLSDHEPHHQRNGRDRLEIEQGLDADTSDFLEIAHRAYPVHDRAEDDRRDHHLDERNEPVTKRFERDAGVWKIMADEDADGDREQDLNIENCVPGASRFGRRQAGKSFQAVFPLSATKNSRSSR